MKTIVESRGVPQVAGYGDGRLCARFDIMNASSVDEVTLDDTITIVVKGKVKSLRGREEYKTKNYDGETKAERSKEVKRIIPGSVEIEIEEFKVAREGEFDALMED